MFASGQASHTDSYFIVPSKRVKDFIGRECLLDEIRSRFTSHEIELPSILILYALGGQGKSQLALEYCRRWRDTYHGVFWIDANSATTVTQSYSAIATEVVGGQQIETSDSDVLIRMVKGHLERWSEAWLLVFDNYDDPKSFPEVKQFIPTSRACSLLMVDHTDTDSRGLRPRTFHQPHSRSRPTRHPPGNPIYDNRRRRKAFAAWIQ